MNIIGGRMNGKVEFAKAVNEMIDRVIEDDERAINNMLQEIERKEESMTHVYLAYCIIDDTKVTEKVILSARKRFRIRKELKQAGGYRGVILNEYESLADLLNRYYGMTKRRKA